MAVDVSGLERFDGVGGALLAGAEFGEAGRIQDGYVCPEEVEPLEVGGGKFRLCRIGLAEAHFDVDARGVEIDAILANVNGKRVGDSAAGRSSKVVSAAASRIMKRESRGDCLTVVRRKSRSCGWRLCLRA